MGGAVDRRGRRPVPYLIAQIGRRGAEFGAVVGVDVAGFSPDVATF